jgi:hypothetical protein
MMVLSCCHKKFSGHVFTLYASHGIKCPEPTSPDFQIHLPTHVSAHKAVFTISCSVQNDLNSLYDCLKSSSVFISTKI